MINTLIVFELLIISNILGHKIYTNEIKIYHYIISNNFFGKYILVGNLKETIFQILDIKKKIWIFGIRDSNKNYNVIIQINIGLKK